MVPLFLGVLCVWGSKLQNGIMWMLVQFLLLVPLFVGFLCLRGSKIQNGILKLSIQSLLLVLLIVFFVFMGFLATKWDNVVVVSIFIVDPIVCVGGVYGFQSYKMG